MNPMQRRVLCVESHADTCSMLSALLGRIGYQTVAAAAVADALKKAHSERFDLYLVDDWYEDGTSLELCRELRKLDAHTPILFYSTAARESDRQQAIEAGAQDYVIKPGDIGELAKIVQRLVESTKSVTEPTVV